jgi:alkyl sulfatase BDS1-like metallo-beta-lactamase superfamily hydrolase
MDNQGFVSVEFLFSLFIILIIAFGLLLYAQNTVDSSLNVESDMNHRLILDNVANRINQVDSQGEFYSQYIKLPVTDKNYVLTLDKNELIIEYDNKKGEMFVPFIEPYSTYKMYPGHIYVIEKTHEGKILIK